MSAAARRAWVEQIMGLPVSVHLRGDGVHGEEAARAAARVFAHLRSVDRLLSPYRPDSELCRWNRGELPLGRCAAAVREVVALCGQARERTGGWFDPWRVGTLPCDPTGLVKGWAVQEAAGLLAGWEFCLNAGGDLVAAAGDGGAAWRVGIEDPADPARLVGVLHTAAGAVATSGTARRGAHLVDPYRGVAATGVASVTVVGPSLLWADVYATAVAACGTDGLSLLAGTGYEGLLLTPDGARRATPGFRYAPLVR
ncbi:FAD:protein FMN transferase [Catellatospora sp. TT07R-123]|uniref:FAD:protein FMN transferase n=1 Tax=Catellatospora sp. TT07R-123 TaxID=2733863 RepID=UPI001BB44467|nr:FAD:protein FMN transferase [Catellatospora sp. TT07R-123]